jgi:uncharacterized protein YggE
MKRIINSMVSLSILLFFTFPAFAQDRPVPRLITVTGDSEVKVTPDEITLSLGVETWNKDLTIAKNENDQRIRTLVAVVKKLGIEQKHIKTDYISIEPRYEDQWQHQRFVGYFVRKTVVLTIRDISKFEAILSSALEAGANYVHGIEFRTTELRKYRDQARELAIKAAREKATDLAGSLGQKIGRPNKIQEDHSGWWSGYNSWWGSRWQGGMTQNVVQNTVPSDGDGSISVGQIKVSARVTVSFELE